MLSWTGWWENRPYLLGLCWSPSWWNWQDGWTALRQGPLFFQAREASGRLLIAPCLPNPFSANGDSDLVAWTPGTAHRVSVCANERSVCPQKHACFHLQVNINNTFCHQGMFVMAKGWREFNAAALLGKAAGQHFTTCHHSLPKRHLATNLQKLLLPFFNATHRLLNRDTGIISVPQGYQEQQRYNMFLFDSDRCFSHLLKVEWAGVVHHLEHSQSNRHLDAHKE